MQVYDEAETTSPILSPLGILLEHPSPIFLPSLNRPIELEKSCIISIHFPFHFHRINRLSYDIFWTESAFCTYISTFPALRLFNIQHSVYMYICILRLSNSCAAPGNPLFWMQRKFQIDILYNNGISIFSANILSFLFHYAKLT